MPFSAAELRAYRAKLRNARGVGARAKRDKLCLGIFGSESCDAAENILSYKW